MLLQMALFHSLLRLGSPPVCMYAPHLPCLITCLWTVRLFPRRRQWQPTPVLLPGKSHGWRNLVGCSPWGRTWLSDFTFAFHFHALEKEMATHSSVLAWRIPGTGEPGGLPSLGSHRVGHDWSDLAAAAGCFHVLAIVYSTAVSLGVHVPFWIMVFSRYIPRSGIAGSCEWSSSLWPPLCSLCYFEGPLWVH